MNPVLSVKRGLLQIQMLTCFNKNIKKYNKKKECLETKKKEHLKQGTCLPKCMLLAKHPLTF